MAQSRSFRQTPLKPPRHYRTPSPPARGCIEPLSPIRTETYPPSSAQFTSHPSHHPVQQSSALDALATLATSPTFNSGTFASPQLAASEITQWHGGPAPKAAGPSQHRDVADDLAERPSKRARSEAPVRNGESISAGESRPSTSYVQQNSWNPASEAIREPQTLSNGKTKAAFMEDVNLLLDFSRGNVINASENVDTPPSGEAHAIHEGKEVGLGLLEADPSVLTESAANLSQPNVEYEQASSKASHEATVQANQLDETDVYGTATDSQNLATKKDTRGNRGWPKGVPRGPRGGKVKNSSAKAEETTTPAESENQSSNASRAKSTDTVKRIRKKKDNMTPVKRKAPKSRPSPFSHRRDLNLFNRGHDSSAFYTRPSNMNLLMSKDDTSLVPRGRLAPAPLNTNEPLNAKTAERLTQNLTGIPDFLPDQKLESLTPSSLQKSGGTRPRRHVRSYSAPILYSDEALAKHTPWADSLEAASSIYRSASECRESKSGSHSLGTYQGASSNDDVEGVNFAKCAGCSLVQNCLGDGEEAETLSWISCDGCKRWFHMACAGLTEHQMRTVDKFSCRECWKKYGPTTFVRKSSRAHASIDYAGLNEGLVKTSAENPDHPYIKPLKERTLKFLPDDLPRLRPHEVSFEALQVPGFFTRPLLIPAYWNPRPEASPSTLDAVTALQIAGDSSIGLPNAVETIKKWFAGGLFNIDLPDRGEDEIGMVIPSDLTVRHVSNLYGQDEKVEVIDVKTQGEAGPFTLKKWADYYESKQRKLIRNVISLEISCSFLGKLIKRPDSVRKMDLSDSVWPKELRMKGDWPKVQSYCLMSVADSFTDFHIDFGGSSVFYHILKGKKTFLFIPPKPKHLKKYEQWCLSPAQNQTFLPDQTKECMRIDLSEGDTMLIPSGWIHAVWTPEDSLVIGGNFLTRLHYGMQIQIFEVEKATRVPQKFRHPHFQRVMWFTVIKYLESDPTPPRVVEQLHGGEQFVRHEQTQAQAINTVAENVTSPDEQGKIDPQLLADSIDQEVSNQLLGEALQAQEKTYPQMELDGLHDLCRYLLRTALIVGGKITDGITNETRARVGRAIPKGYGDPIEIMKQFAVWIAWKRGNEHIPEWAYPEYIFETNSAGSNQKLNTAALKKLERDASQAAKRRNPIRNPIRNTVRKEYEEVSVSGAKKSACESCRKKRVRCLHPTAREQGQPSDKPNDLATTKVEPSSLNTPPTATKTSPASTVKKTAPSKAVINGILSTPKVATGPKIAKSRACDDCRRSKRRCLHDENGKIDQAKAQAALEYKSSGKKRRHTGGDKAVEAEKTKTPKMTPSKANPLSRTRDRSGSNASTIILEKPIPSIEFDRNRAAKLSEKTESNGNGVILPDEREKDLNGLTEALRGTEVEGSGPQEQIESPNGQLSADIALAAEEQTAIEPTPTPLVEAPVPKPSPPISSPTSEDELLLIPTSPEPNVPHSTASTRFSNFSVTIPPQIESIPLPPTPQPNPATLNTQNISIHPPPVSETQGSKRNPPHHPSSPLSPPTTLSEHDKSDPTSVRSTISPAQGVQADAEAEVGAAADQQHDLYQPEEKEKEKPTPPKRRLGRPPKKKPSQNAGEKALAPAHVVQLPEKSGRKQTQRDATDSPVASAKRKRASGGPALDTQSQNPETERAKRTRTKSISEDGGMKTTSPNSKKGPKPSPRVIIAPELEKETDEEASLRLAKELSGVEFGLRRRGVS